MLSTELRIKELLRRRRWTTKVLAEKTGMSESYLTHIKNGTRRWNEDALKKLAKAFEIEPTEMFSVQRGRTDKVQEQVQLVSHPMLEKNLKVVPIVGEIPQDPSPYNNQVAQLQSGNEKNFVPVFSRSDDAMFCYQVTDDKLAPQFLKGDLLIISPDVWSKSGDIAAVEWGQGDQVFRAIKKISYMDDFIVIDSVNHVEPPIALVRGKDHFRVVGKVIYRYQNF